MIFSYKLRDGRHVRIFDKGILDSTVNGLKFVEGYIEKDYDHLHDEEFDLDEKVSFPISVLEDENGCYFTMVGEKIYFDNYEYLSIPELIEKLDNREYVPGYIINISLIKGASEVAFVEPRRVQQNNDNHQSYMQNPMWNYPDHSVEFESVICVPIELKYTRMGWVNMIETVPISPDGTLKYNVESHYMVDYLDWIIAGYVKIIKREDISTYTVPKGNPFRRVR